MTDIQTALDGSWTMVTDSDGVVSVGVINNHVLMLAQDRHGPHTPLAILTLAEVNMLAAALEVQRRRLMVGP